MSTWQDRVEKAKHYRATDNTRLFLSDDDLDDRPWEYVTSLKTGGSHRLDLDTSVQFEAIHPSGLTFTWFLDLEVRDANGRSHYIVATDRIAKVLGLLRGVPRTDFADYLRQCAGKLRENAAKFTEIAAKEYGDASLLETLTREVVVA